MPSLATANAMSAGVPRPHRIDATKRSGDVEDGPAGWIGERLPALRSRCSRCRAIAPCSLRALENSTLLMAVACDCGEPIGDVGEAAENGMMLPPERARCSARFEEAARTLPAQIGGHRPGQRWPTSQSATNCVGVRLTPIDQRAPAIERSCARPNAPHAPTSRDVRGRARGVASRHFSPSASPSAAAPACHRGSGGPQRR
jgi:hypothetical protein